MPAEKEGEIQFSLTIWLLPEDKYFHFPAEPDEAPELPNLAITGANVGITLLSRPS